MESRWILLGLILIANAVLMIFLGKRKKEDAVTKSWEE